MESQLVAEELAAVPDLLGQIRRLPEYLAGVASGSLVVLALGAGVPAARSLALQPARHPERYRVADDLREPIAAVVAVAEGETSAAQQAPADR